LGASSRETRESFLLGHPFKSSLRLMIKVSNKSFTTPDSTSLFNGRAEQKTFRGAGEDFVLFNS
jgi:hypothetical protein